MTVKVSDIVSYGGPHYRVMKRSPRVVYISGKNDDHVVPVSDVTLVKSTTLPNIEVGDNVIVHTIPRYERDEEMDGVWVSEMDEFIGGTYVVEKTWSHEEYGPLVKLNGYWFQTYHPEPIHAFDMI